MGASWSGEVGNEMVYAALMNGCKTEGKTPKQICQALEGGFHETNNENQRELGHQQKA